MSKLTGPQIAECSTWLSIVSKLFGTRMSILLEPHGLTQGQFSILNHLTRQRLEGGSRISEIAAAVEVEQPAVTKTIAKFRNMGLVEIVGSPTDKRAKLVSPTPAAGQLLGEIYRDMGPDLFQVFGSLADGDVDELTKMLKQLGRWLDQNRLG
ncbi:MarR family winged helix-turn-helix transcriptional regulator [Sulfitobacter donghicola]|uniref:HTH marR-type domain-containing protein n=1 Tax=Sulfitobacter donghicola DSW-25 = KCTC 12864 = JCM 14565 TaxID=1300350 RepID=A0A073INF7_9RHOB|nr:MarR family winged helix-turn-helix transcriptional regulator [Sulfitobacter donghicola]KEJ91090.1 hypothetical protein DSW25_03135 [Sulfitobacter donghicola DSW-25 = KCTC 12864 = JCM 14565]KIN68190.1 Transcriptional regulator, MarR family [Sulfitobacter donghicola DSW-25 = KCTC 12864 = JCM 14565]